MQQKSSYSESDIADITRNQHDVNSQLPTGNMSVFDDITLITKDEGLYGLGVVEAEYQIKPDHWYFDCHFPGDPIMPGCLGLDALWQLSGFYLRWLGHKGKGRALGSKDIKFFGEVLPSTQFVTYRVHPKRILIRDIKVIFADGDVYADGKHIYSAKGLKVALT